MDLYEKINWNIDVIFKIDVNNTDQMNTSLKHVGTYNRYIEHSMNMIKHILTCIIDMCIST